MELSALPIVSTGYVHDGYTRDDGYIAAAKPGPSGDMIHGELSFSYRVASRRELVLLDSKMENALRDEYKRPEASLEAEDIVCGFIAGKVVSWSLRDIGGHSVPLSAEACGKITSVLFNRLYRIIRGLELSDKKPEAKTAPPSDGELQKN